MVTDLSAQNPDCSLYTKPALSNGILNSVIMRQDQKIVDNLGRGIWLSLSGNSTQALLTVKLVDPDDCLPQEARIIFTFEDNVQQTFIISPKYACLHSGKVDFMDLDQSKPGLYQISQLRRFRYVKILSVTVETNKDKLILPLTFNQNKFILNTMKCILE